MDLVVATVFVSPIVKLLITKVLTYCSNEIALLWGVKGQLEKLAVTLELIEVVLHDAEKRQVENRVVNFWLEKLKDVVYDAEDVLAELEYKDLRRAMKKRAVGIGFGIAQKIQDVNDELDEITRNMERFKFIIQLSGSSSNAVVHENIPETSSHINDSAAVVGRKDDVSKILDLLIDCPESDCNQESYSVVRITGMGGIGKTTLAQLVFADNSLEDHFVIKLWVSVSQKTKDKEIFMDLLEPHFDRQLSLNAIKSRLKERLLVGKCLIILDDVWTDHGIRVDELLKDLLSMSCQGSKILLTMRSAEAIPPRTGFRYTIYQLKGLLENDCWSIFEKTAFAHGGAKETPDLINIGKKIASKCGGLPLAAKTLGGLLYSRNDQEEWLSILNSPIWNLPTGENKIISLLKLSYDHLSPYVKRCFSYCSIFPKGHYFMKKELIRMWMAEGFLNSPWQPNASPETVGNEYFKILLLNSFFQDERKNKWGDVKSCRMHDLVHDLAISIAGSGSRMVKISSEKLATDDAEVIKQSNKFRRLGLQVLDDDVSAIPSAIYNASKLHTLVSFCPDFYEYRGGDCVWAKQIFNLSLLRVLNLSHAGIEELPQSICKLKHLRYFDLSHNKIKSFPDSFSQLYNLQTLRLKGCDLEELPKDMQNLIGLEYLICSSKLEFTQLPRKVSRLRKLKKLSVFCVGRGRGYGIEELKDLNLLGGKLVIKNLGIGIAIFAGQANLIGKKNIKHLRLIWNLGAEVSRRNFDILIDGLQPHPNLKKLEIVQFCDSWFPTWMSTSIHLPNLVHLTIQDCSKCERLPALGQLQSLRYLHMASISSVKQIGNEFYQSNGEPSFPSLVELHISHFFNLEEWIGDQRSSASSFSCLETLKISDCQKLSITPTRFPSLKILDFAIELRSHPKLKSLPLKLLRGANNVLRALLVRDCDEFVGFLKDNDEEQQHYKPDDPSNNFLSKIEIFSCPSLTVLPADFWGLNSLTHLAIEGCKSIKSLPDGIQYLPALHTLIIGGFSETLTTFPFPTATTLQGTNGTEGYFVSLRELTICGWFNLTVLPDQIQHITSLQRLNIRKCHGLLSLPEWFGELSSLQTLGIESCRKLKYFPSEEQMLRLTSLQILLITSCPFLMERCRTGNEEAHKIAYFNLTKASPSHSQYVRTGDTQLIKSRKGKEKL